jgi:diguanylate cyclase (GGDEF)-like protein
MFHLLFLMTFMFGIFRLDTFMMLTLGLFAAAGYGLMVLLLMLGRPEALDLKLELLRWAVVAALLAWFSVMGGYISRMRKQLSTNRNDLEVALQTIRGMTVQDELTGAPNRRFLMNALRQQQSRSVRTGESFCLGLVDIDLFKRVNDTLGHSAGDTVLRLFCESAMKGMRASDQFGRYGGEEFLLLLGRSSMPEALIGAERLRQNTAALRFPVDGELSVTISIGLAEYRPGEDVEDTLKRADLALSRAKDAGRNRVECEESLSALASAA